MPMPRACAVGGANSLLPNGAAIPNSFDTVGRLTGTYLRSGAGSALDTHSYGYNLGNQRTSHTRTDGSYVDTLMTLWAK